MYGTVYGLEIGKLTNNRSVVARRTNVGLTRLVYIQMSNGIVNTNYYFNDYVPSIIPRSMSTRDIILDTNLLVLHRTIFLRTLRANIKRFSLKKLNSGIPELVQLRTLLKGQLI